MNHCHRQCAIGTRFWRNMNIGFFGCFGRITIDYDDFRTFFLRFFNNVPVMQIGADRIAGPDDDVFGMNKTFRIDTGCRSHG